MTITNSGGQAIAITNLGAISVSSTSSQVALGPAGLATGATVGFVTINSIGGTPTGVPSGIGSAKPFIYDSSANRLWIYNAAWRFVQLGVASCTGTPTIAAGVGAGTGPSISISGTDCAFKVTLTTGTGASVGVDYVVTFQNAFDAVPSCVSMPKNQATNALFATANKTPFINSGGLTSIQVANVGTALSDSTIYAWDWLCSS